VFPWVAVAETSGRAHWSLSRGGLEKAASRCHPRCALPCLGAASPLSDRHRERAQVSQTALRNSHDEEEARDPYARRVLALMRRTSKLDGNEPA